MTISGSSRSRKTGVDIDASGIAAGIIVVEAGRLKNVKGTARTKTGGQRAGDIQFGSNHHRCHQ